MSDEFSFSSSLKTMIDRTVEGLAGQKFKVDPIAGKAFSQLPSIVGSMQKRHGLIIESAIFEAVDRLPNYTAWKEPNFHISQDVQSAVASVNNVKQNPDWKHLLGNEYPYKTGTGKTLQVDLLAFNKTTSQAFAVEIKRGYSNHDAGKKKAILKDALSVQMLLKSYCEMELGTKIFEARSLICSFYKSSEFDPSVSVNKDTLDELFGADVLSYVENVNNYYRKNIHDLLRTLATQSAD